MWTLKVYVAPDKKLRQFPPGSFAQTKHVAIISILFARDSNFRPNPANFRSQAKNTRVNKTFRRKMPRLNHIPTQQ